MVIVVAVVHQTAQHLSSSAAGPPHHGAEY